MIKYRWILTPFGLLSVVVLIFAIPYTVGEIIGHHKLLTIMANSQLITATFAIFIFTTAVGFSMTCMWLQNKLDKKVNNQTQTQLRHKRITKRKIVNPRFKNGRPNRTRR